MKGNIKVITILSIIIVILGTVASLMGLLSLGKGNEFAFTTIRGEKVMLYGHGLYKYDTISVAMQAIAQDGVTLFIGIPLLIFSIIFFRKGSIRAKLLLTGTIGYFLYAYGTYAFLSAYNELFLVYVALFSISLFTFILSLMEFNIAKIPLYFSKKMPIKSTVIFLFLVGLMLGLMWLGRIIPPLISGGIPYGLESYSTLTIQVFDLGLIVPLSILSGVLLLKKRPWGYLLTSILLIKGLTLYTAVAVMAIVQVLVGIEVNMGEIVIFLGLTLFALIITWRFLINVKPPKNIIERM
ncbi:hypothetical protein GOQ29_08440 [Clostridium sp. D2Q-14]|uniref:hypothetical protein n=1 Tax=Anaeromonas gelatinilytica TaxID=2683194 RepID=UPI00193B1413|nr:hypothetical protein [Anaeromonas gelatinilytica]MBS4535648.1 hypothetical protein [Anaeromonas gelatinilytica]